jgi:hypothetical protein
MLARGGMGPEKLFPVSPTYCKLVRLVMLEGKDPEKRLLNKTRVSSLLNFASDGIDPKRRLKLRSVERMRMSEMFLLVRFLIIFFYQHILNWATPPMK